MYVKNGRKKTEWWNDNIASAMKEERVIWLRWLQNSIVITLGLQRDQTKRVKVLVRVAKKSSWVKFCIDFESTGQ